MGGSGGEWQRSNNAPFSHSSITRMWASCSNLNQLQNIIQQLNKILKKKDQTKFMLISFGEGMSRYHLQIFNTESGKVLVQLKHTY